MINAHVTACTACSFGRSIADILLRHRVLAGLGKSVDQLHAQQLLQGVYDTLSHLSLGLLQPVPVIGGGGVQGAGR